MYALLMLGKVPSNCLKTLFRTVSVGNPVNKNWWPRERDHQLLEEEELWRY
jgi:hypothetical protein